MVANKQKWIIKIGSSLITAKGLGIRQEQLKKLCDEIIYLRQNNIDVVLVSSGAVAEGVVRLGLPERPKSDALLRAAAAVGQMGLIQYYENLFLKDGVNCAQLLLTHSDLEKRERYLNAQSTLKTLLDLNVLPIVNENDSIVIDAIRFGDNDQLAALVANLMEAQKLIILTDQDGMYSSDPNLDSSAEKIQEISVHDERLLKMASRTSASGLGTGGMYSKVLAARLAARSGCSTYIVSGNAPSPIQDIFLGISTGTLLKPNESIMPARKRWLAGQMQTNGRVFLDAGAVKSLVEKGASLLAVGITGVDGEFHRGDAIECVDAQGFVLAVGLSNYSSTEILKIKGLSTQNIPQILGYEAEPSIIHRDNLALRN